MEKTFDKQPKIFQMKKIVIGLIAFMMISVHIIEAQVDERLIGTWSETEDSPRLIVTRDSIEAGGEKIQVYTEAGRVISIRSNLPLMIYRFCRPEEFEESAQGFIDAPLGMFRTTRLTATEEEIADRREEIIRGLEKDDDDFSRAYRYFRDLQKAARNGNLIELDGTGRYLHRRQ